MGEESWPLGDYGGESAGESQSYSSGESQDSGPTDIGCSGDSDYMPWRRQGAVHSDHFGNLTGFGQMKSSPLEEKLGPHESNAARTAKKFAAWLLLPPAAYCALWATVVAGDYLSRAAGLRQNYVSLSEIVGKHGYPWDFRLLR
ncbi:hypothetical protein HY642_04105 [Candidatus Woesearchaeota archaeon]|nr:hypothetical protein [Candidatus Woesearchaeota archaeon]